MDANIVGSPDAIRAGRPDTIVIRLTGRLVGPRQPDAAPSFRVKGTGFRRACVPVITGKENRP
jgi:hypothetical protein